MVPGQALTFNPHPTKSGPPEGGAPYIDLEHWAYWERNSLEAPPGAPEGQLLGPLAVSTTQSAPYQCG